MCIFKHLANPLILDTTALIAGSLILLYIDIAQSSDPKNPSSGGSEVPEPEDLDRKNPQHAIEMIDWEADKSYEARKARKFRPNGELLREWELPLWLEGEMERRRLYEKTLRGEETWKAGCAG